MKTIKVSVCKLLSHLKQNREKHISDHEEAMEVYKELLVVKLEDMLKRAKAGNDVSHTVDIQRPKCYLKSYDDAIAMLSWCTEDEVDLDHAEFRQYVNDEWAWAGEFAATSSMYRGLKGSF